MDKRATDITLAAPDIEAFTNKYILPTSQQTTKVLDLPEMSGDFTVDDTARQYFLLFGARN